MVSSKSKNHTVHSGRWRWCFKLQMENRKSWERQAPIHPSKEDSHHLLAFNSGMLAENFHSSPQAPSGPHVPWRWIWWFEAMKIHVGIDGWIFDSHLVSNKTDELLLGCYPSSNNKKKEWSKAYPPPRAVRFCPCHPWPRKFHCPGGQKCSVLDCCTGFAGFIMFAWNIKARFPKMGDRFKELHWSNLLRQRMVLGLGGQQVSEKAPVLSPFLGTEEGNPAPSPWSLGTNPFGGPFDRGVHFFILKNRIWN